MSMHFLLFDSSVQYILIIMLVRIIHKWCKNIDLEWTRQDKTNTLLKSHLFTFIYNKNSAYIQNIQEPLLKELRETKNIKI
jgi:hypothetical protein